MGIEPSIVHLNEGHAAFVSLELARREYSGNGSLEGRPGGRAEAHGLHHPHARPRRQRHLPGPPGRGRAQAHRGHARRRPRGDHQPRPHEPGRGGGAVRRHAVRAAHLPRRQRRRPSATARSPARCGTRCGRTASVDDVPITHVTNGVHIPTWLGKPIWKLLDRHLGEDWLDRATDPATWAPVDDIPAKEIWDVRTQQRAELIEYVRHRAVVDRLARDEPAPYAEAAASFDPDVLTVGFARRLATYKRLNLLMQDVERAIRVVAGDRPVQVLLAGKAHPRDDGGKRLVHELFTSKHAPGFAERIAYLNDYDLRMAAHLVRGCDVWINLPRPPLEASGTSGMKNVMNGGLQLSVLDGWWAEGYDKRQRLGALGRRRSRPRRAGRPPRPRALPAARGRGRARVLQDGRRRHPARLGRPHPPLAAHARPDVRRRPDARGLREEGLHGARDRSSARRRRRLGRGASGRRRASASPSAPRVGDGVGVGNGVGVSVGTAGDRSARRCAAAASARPCGSGRSCVSSSLLTSSTRSLSSLLSWLTAITNMIADQHDHRRGRRRRASTA